ITLTAAGFGALIGSGGLGPFPSNPLLNAAIGAGAVFLLATVFISLLDWRQGMMLLLVIVLAEDTLRKSLPDAPYWINLGKDFVVAACYLSFLFRRHSDNPQVRLPQRAKGLIIMPLAIWAGFVILECFNPGVTHMLIA